MTPCYIFDIDGTLADNSHRTHHLVRQPKDWDAYHALVAHDTPHNHVCQLAHVLARESAIVLCSGRHDGQRDVTEVWLVANDVPFRGLYMRKEGDHRPDYIIKRELLDQIRADGFEPIMAFDDRNSVVKMWRDAGVPCAQVAEGDF
jgi:hypothetical protein